MYIYDRIDNTIKKSNKEDRPSYVSSLINHFSDLQTNRVLAIVITPFGQEVKFDQLADISDGLDALFSIHDDLKIALVDPRKNNCARCDNNFFFFDFFRDDLIADDGQVVPFNNDDRIWDICVFLLSVLGHHQEGNAKIALRKFDSQLYKEIFATVVSSQNYSSLAKRVGEKLNLK